jgi:hypothetical protein
LGCVAPDTNAANESIASADIKKSFFLKSECSVAAFSWSEKDALWSVATGLVESLKYLVTATLASLYLITKKVGAYFAFRSMAWRREGYANVYSAS